MPVSKERVYLDKQGRATRNAEEGERLLVAEGAQITRELADKHAGGIGVYSFVAGLGAVTAV